MAEYSKVFKEKGVKLLGLSCDDVSSHLEWMKDIEFYAVSFQSFVFDDVVLGFDLN